MQNVFIYIRDNLNKAQFAIIKQINYYKKEITFKKNVMIRPSILRSTMTKASPMAQPYTSVPSYDLAFYFCMHAFVLKTS